MRADVVKWLVVVIALAAAGGGNYYAYISTRPCAHPVVYSIGAIDSRFGVSISTVLAQAKAAASIWNKAAGKTVLVYDPDAKLEIGLFYDERGATTKLGAEITRQQVALDIVHATLDAEQARLTTKQVAYNKRVAEVNARGGASPRDVRVLDAERLSLEQLAASVNSQVASYNASVETLNAKVERYNQTAGHPFEEGKYVRDASGERITIFQFADTTQLRRVLAHELGHAVGLEHNNDPKSIMFAKNESGNLVPTTADLESLKTLCGA